MEVTDLENKADERDEVCSKDRVKLSEMNDL